MNTIIIAVLCVAIIAAAWWLSGVIIRWIGEEED